MAPKILYSSRLAGCLLVWLFGWSIPSIISLARTCNCLLALIWWQLRVAWGLFRVCLRLHLGRRWVWVGLGWLGADLAVKPWLQGPAWPTRPCLQTRKADVSLDAHGGPCVELGLNTGLVKRLNPHTSTAFFLPSKSPDHSLAQSFTSSSLVLR